MDLLRLQGEEVWLRGALDYTAPNMFAGSVLDLAGGHRIRSAPHPHRP